MNDIWEAWDRVDITTKPLGADIEDLFEDSEVFQNCPRQSLFVKGKTML